jgi:uncharacterized surface protein with fasciclin (FAS1) repeats
MRIRRTFTALLAGGLLAGAIAVPAAATQPFGNADAVPGSVYAVLAADDGFDVNGRDYDILEAAAEAVVNGKPGTAVAALNNPAAALTVFAPNDNAFRWLVFSLTGHWYWSEATVLNELVGAVSGLVGPDATIPTIEAVLLYHVADPKYGKVLSSSVPGLNGADISTVGGGTFRINVGKWFVSLVDKDPNALNPTLVKSGLDIQTSNGNSVIHTISLVLRPLDLPRGF